jgi:hypothetical protein
MISALDRSMRLTIAVSVVALSLTGCNYNPIKNLKYLMLRDKRADMVIDKHHILCLPKSWVFIDKAGKVAIDRKFRFAGSFTNGISITGDGPDNWTHTETLVDKTGKCLISFGFDDISPATEDYFVVTGPASNLNNDAQNFVRNDELPLLRQTFFSFYRGLWKQRYAKCGHFSQGAALVYTDGNSDEPRCDTVWTRRPARYFLVDKYAEQLHDIDGVPQNDSLDFFEGLQPVAKKGKVGFIDTRGNWAVQPVYDHVENFHDSAARVILPGANSKWFFIDKNGKRLFEKEFQRVSDFHEGLARFGDGKQDSGFVDKTGRIAIKAAPDVKQFADFSEGKARFYTTNLSEGFIDSNGKVLIPAAKPHIHFSDFHDGLCLAKIDTGKKMLCGFIDTTGNWAIKPIYSSAIDFSEGLAAVRISDSAP